MGAEMPRKGRVKTTVTFRAGCTCGTVGQSFLLDPLETTVRPPGTALGRKGTVPPAEGPGVLGPVGAETFTDRQGQETGGAGPSAGRARETRQEV